MYVKKPVQELICKVCFLSFLPKKAHPAYKYCSPQCKDKYNKSKESYKESRRIYAKKRHLENPEERKLRDQKRYIENKEVFYENNAKRRYKLRLSSTPKWDEELTSLVFQEAQRLRLLRNKLTGFEWHVDHIIPISGKTVSGLHVWNNFAVIPKVENLHKGNRNAIHEERQTRLCT